MMGYNVTVGPSVTQIIRSLKMMFRSLYDAPQSHIKLHSMISPLRRFGMFYEAARNGEQKQKQKSIFVFVFVQKWGLARNGKREQKSIFN
jgi:hypothetical protein